MKEEKTRLRRGDFIHQFEKLRYLRSASNNKCWNSIEFCTKNLIWRRQKSKCFPTLSLPHLASMTIQHSETLKQDDEMSNRKIYFLALNQDMKLWRMVKGASARDSWVSSRKLPLLISLTSPSALTLLVLKIKNLYYSFFEIFQLLVFFWVAERWGDVEWEWARRSWDESDFNKIYQKTEAVKIFINFSSIIFTKIFRETFLVNFLLNWKYGRMKSRRRRIK